MAKRSSDTRVAYPEVKVQVRDLVRVVGIVTPFDPGGGWGIVLGKNSFNRVPWVNGHNRSMPGSPRSGTPRESQAKFRNGIRFVGKLGVQDEVGGGRHVAKRSSDPPCNLHRSQSSGMKPRANRGYC